MRGVRHRLVEPLLLEIESLLFSFTNVQLECVHEQQDATPYATVRPLLPILGSGLCQRFEQLAVDNLLEPRLSQNIVKLERG